MGGTGPDVVVVGAGVMGSATAAALARSGRRVTLVEQFRVGHRRGSSHGASRIFRFSYPDPRYVRMMQEALPLWRRLEEEVGERLLHVTGGLDGGEGIDRNAEAMDACGVPFERLDGAEVSRRFASIAARSGERFLFQAEGGIVAADRAIRAFVTSFERHGGELVEGRAVVELRPHDDEIHVVLDGETHRAPVAVVTAGGWARELLATAGIRLPVRPTRETVAYFEQDEDVPFPTLVEWGEPAGYALRNPGRGIKVGEHGAGPEVNPDEEGGPSQDSVERLRTWIGRRFPRAEPEAHLTETCLYTNTADESFILERRGRLVIGSPCSGHGFKFAPLIGDRLAVLAEEAVRG
jgi:sarcosine oxidase